jgi:hypothetical protein
MFIEFPKVSVPVNGTDTVALPPLMTIRQRYDRAKIDDPAAYLSMALIRDVTSQSKLAGKRIAVTVGSRGIPCLDKMILSVCDTLKQWGAKPFIVPAMGSHGGATAEGQLEMLAGYGITEAAMWVPILSSMDTVQYGVVDGMPVYCDKLAFEADGTVIFNKVKPHTDFKGEYESGLAKMIAIGLGKHHGAAAFHALGMSRFPELLPKAAEEYLKHGNPCFAVGVVQNAYDDISDVRVCMPDKILETDRELLKIAKDKLPGFKFDHIDLLIVDEMGKNISGTGCDPNIIGRNLTNTFHGMLDLQKLFVRGITPEAHHNGCGLGMVDITTRACLNQVDWEVTWTNCLTVGCMTGGSIPFYANNDEEAIRQCLATCQGNDHANPRVARIRNTLCMEEIQVSPAIYESIKTRDDVDLLKPAEPMVFDDEGGLR